MEQRGITNVLLGLISILLAAILLTQTCGGNRSDFEVSSPHTPPAEEINDRDDPPEDNARPRIHLLSDVSGRLFLREDLNPAPRDLNIIRQTILTILTSKKSYGVSAESIISQDTLDSLRISDNPKYIGNYAKKFPNVSFSKLRSIQSKNYAIISPEGMIDRFKYRSESAENNISLRSDLKNLVNGVRTAYMNYDSKGVNTLAALEKYMSTIEMEDDFNDVFVVLTDGYVNTNEEKVWSPSQIQRARRDSIYKSGLFRESQLSIEDGKLILLETGGRDFDPMIGDKDEVMDNDILKELWTHWAQSAGFKEIIWKTKWDRQISQDWIEKNLLE